MEKAGKRFVFMMVLLGAIAILIPSYSTALEAIKLGEESQVTFYGFFRNNTGMFLEGRQPFTENNNQLATERNWFRAYTDYKINNQFRFFSTIQFVYEPEYEIEDGSTSSRTATDGPTKPGPREYSEYNNINDVLREIYLEWKPSKGHTIRFGRQIAIWGEAMTTRVGDVIHPDDTRFTFAFANLEDTRIPQWMVRGTHDIPNLSSSFEWIVNPNLVQNVYRVSRAGSFSILGSPGQRFGLNPETRFNPPYSVTNPNFGPPFSIPDVVVAPPFSRDWVHSPFVPGTGWVATALPFVDADYPGNSWEDLRGGFRTNTTLSGWNFGLTYFHTQNYIPLTKRGNIIPNKFDPITHLPYREYTLVFPNIDIIGGYLNKQLPWPGVLRAEVTYTPNMPFNTFDPTDSDALVRRADIKYMIAYDLTSFFYFQWHKTAPFDITFEHTGEWIPKSKDIQFAIYDTRVRTWNPGFNMRISTNWLYNLIATDLIVGYSPFGNSGLIMPSATFTPNWLNKALSFQLQYIHIYANNNFTGLGVFKGKDMLVLTSQFNW